MENKISELNSSQQSYKQQYYRKKRNTIVQMIGGRCCKCFRTHDLEIHHIKPIKMGRGRGRFDRLTEWKKAIQKTPTNIAAECSECHPRSADDVL